MAAAPSAGPASHTGLVGFKPSIGHIARGDGFPETGADCEVVGILTRSVADTIVLDSVLGGSDHRDPRSALIAVPLTLEPTRLRILYVPRFDDAPLDPEIVARSRRPVDLGRGPGRRGFVGGGLCRGARNRRKLPSPRRRPVPRL
ncbi:amidase family protein [Lichenifustis flavocetrariae]|uniref:amidase family protein n=1 Tax=Lichenifustis flavocetrariae TaxID=2949735 RepID=UPI003D134926